VIDTLLTTAAFGLLAVCLGVGLRAGWEIGGILVMWLRYPLRRIKARQDFERLAATVRELAEGKS